MTDDREKKVLPGILTRQQPPVAKSRVALAGAGGALTIALLALLTDITALPILLAGFGSSCVLLYTVPAAPFSQPLNVIGGHVIAGVCGVVVSTLLPHTWWSIGLAVGVAIAIMAALRLTHPPAGGTPIAAIVAGAGWDFVLIPVLVGSVLIVLLAVLFHKSTGAEFPVRQVPG